MENINNLTVYNDAMRKSMKDKLFFMDIIGDDFKVLVDHGCADGTLLSFVRERNPHLILTGVDMNQDMLNIAKQKVPNGIFMKSFFPEIPDDYNFYPTALNLNSVLHEVFTYCSHGDEKTFWNKVRTKGYKYIVVRDMVYNDTAVKIANPIDITKLFKRGDQKQIEEFESFWGDIRYHRNLIHFLLKYRYTVNWKREVKENYLGYSTEDIIRNIGTGYKLIYRKDYILPFLYQQVKKDFGIEIDVPTHTNLIFKIIN